MSGQNATPFGLVTLRAYAVVLVLIGAALAAGGGHLLRLGGSPYYLICGLAVIASGVLLWLRRAEGAGLYGAVLLATLAWSLWEAGYDGWALMPRIAAPAVLGLVLLLPVVRGALIRRAPPWSWLRAVAAIAVAAVLGAALRTFMPPAIATDPLYQTGMTQAPAQAAPLAVDAADSDWVHYGKTLASTRFSALNQITPANAAGLALAWRADIGPTVRGLETTPVKIGRALYVCTAQNDVIALDAETGKQLWRFDAKPQLANVHAVCRGVAYYRVPDATGACAERIITNTVDARLVALDAHDGKPCADFGSNGQVSLLTGMGEVISGYYYPTSAPTIVQGKIVVGGWVSDDQYWGEPSGVIRAFDAVTGKFAWAWDAGRPDRQTEPAEGEIYTPSTPNSWGPMAADETLGLVYAPTGNAPPDYWGVYRRPFDDQYSTAVVAIDAATGKARWVFQTVHHDLWDYDVASPPTLVDLPTADGVVPALIQTNKSGEMYVLNRVTGEPIKPVEERPVPQTGGLPEEKLSPTQPFSVAMPSFRGAQIGERDMWGVTALDQLWCRIKFREARYEGIYTPPGLTPAIAAPGYAGGMEWGGVAVDTTRNIAIVNTSYVFNYTRLMTRDEANTRGMKRSSPQDPRLVDFGRRGPQENTPYAAIKGGFFSPLNIPCNQPPYGRLSAVDLASGKLIWTKVFGTAEDVGPLGTRSGLPFALGTFNLGGAAITQTGVFFIGATQDRHIRAYDTATGTELWKAGLPAAGNATPITYISPDSGRQFVVIAAGGAAGVELNMGDSIMAFALPKAAHP